MDESQEEELVIPLIFSTTEPNESLNGFPDEFPIDDGVFVPPWRDNGAADIIQNSLEEMVRTLYDMISEGRIANNKIMAYRAKFKYPLFLENASFDEEIHEVETMLWVEIFFKFRSLEHRLACSARTAILMAAINLEACVNKFCYFNLGENTTEAIERSPLLTKLAVISRVFGELEFKEKDFYKAAKALFKWRDAFAHGKCPDMPAKTIKQNHLTLPKKQLNSKGVVEETVEHISGYLRVYGYLSEVSESPNKEYNTKQWSLEREIEKLQKFKFKNDLIIECN